MARTRTRTSAASQGFVARYSEYQNPKTTTLLDPPALQEELKCTDEDLSPGKDHVLRIVKRYNNFEPLTGVYPSNDVPVRVTYAGARPTWADTLGAAVVLLPTRPTNNVLATKVLADSNPSRPEVDLGVTIAELREAPQLLFQAGRNLLRNGANFYLSYSFGWKPLVNDMLDLLDVPPKVDQRVKQLEKAAREGGMRRRVQLGYSALALAQSNHTIMSSFGYALSASRRRESQRRLWGTVRYTPSWNGKFPKTDDERRAAATRACYGLLIDPSTAWNLIPWSWMIDYFGTLGDVLEANRNTVGLSPGPVSIMEHTTTKEVFDVRTDGYGSVIGGTGRKVTETKSRDIVTFILPDFKQPLLNPGQLSNLGSLAVLRIPRDLLKLWDFPGPRRRR